MHIVTDLGDYIGEINRNRDNGFGFTGYEGDLSGHLEGDYQRLAVFVGQRIAVRICEFGLQTYGQRAVGIRTEQRDLKFISVLRDADKGIGRSFGVEIDAVAKDSLGRRILNFVGTSREACQEKAAAQCRKDFIEFHNINPFRVE